jgi:hypothetical protein
VRAATITFTASSITLCFFILTVALVIRLGRHHIRQQRLLLESLLLDTCLHSFSQLHVCEYKVTKIIYAFQAFFQFIPNYFWFSHFLFFVKSCVTTKFSVKQFQNRRFRPDTPDFQPFSAFWTFVRGNSDFPLTKPPLSPNETTRFPKALFTLSLQAFFL